MKTKKNLAVLLAAVFVLLSSAVSFASEGIVASGGCGENVSFELTSDGVLTISGPGTMKDLTADDVLSDANPLYSIENESGTLVRSIVINEGVTHIGSWAFGCLSHYITVSIPASVVSIGENAFRYCRSLREFIVDENNARYASPDGVLIDMDTKTLLNYPCNDYCYPDPAPLSEIRKAYTVPDYVLHIADWAFAVAHNVEDITLPDGLLTIGEASFFECRGLKHIYFGESLRSIGKAAFYTCTSLEEIIVPETLTELGEYAFYCCSAYDPEETGVTNIVLHCGITEIKEGTFTHSLQLKTLTLTNKVRKIEAGAFNSCSKLTDIYFEGTEAEWNSIEKAAGNDALSEATVHYIPADGSGEQDVPSGFMAIIQKIEQFFVRIAGFFKNLFGIG